MSRNQHAIQKIVVDIPKDSNGYFNRWIGKYGNIKKFLSKLLCALIPVRIWRKQLQFILMYDPKPFHGFREMLKSRAHKDFTYQLSILACLKNEADYIGEWIEYYKLMGVEHFYIYNNNSTDNIEEVLTPYMEEGLVTLVEHPGLAMQTTMYAHALKHFRLETKWLIIADIDEFMLPKSHATLIDFVNAHSQYNQLITQWSLFGDSGHKKKPDGLVIENFVHKEAFSTCAYNTKVITRPSKTVTIGVHISTTSKSKICSLDEIQCNHYFTKSEEEYLTKKSARGSVLAAANRHTMDRYERFNKNEVYDDSMLQYVDKIKAALAAKNRL
ncbi:MAG: glycosyltransferase family 92 protein [Pseudomonadota bacterium]